MAEKKKKSNWPFALIFLIGLAILLYPQVSRLYYSYTSEQDVASYENEKQNLVPEDVERRINLAHAYNSSLKNGELKDPYTNKEKEEGRAEYARMLEINEQIGHVRVPKIDVDLPIYAGTTDSVLEKGVGHLEGTSLPVGGENTHSVLTAHSGLPTAKLFSDLDKLEVGDIIYVHNIKEILAYKVDQIKKVEPTNFEDLLIEPGKDEITLLTCTPIMINSHRLLVRAQRIDYVPEQDVVPVDHFKFIKKYGFYFAEGLVIILIFYSLFFKKKKKKVNEDEV